ncbi:MAG: DUF3368 domain-containing protein [Blastocatellia bacterium]
MSNDQVVVDSSPLITLCKSDEEKILPMLFGNIVVPLAVCDEILAGGERDPAAQKLQTLLWVHREESIFVPPIIQAWDVGGGEAEVLAFALSSGYLAILDDAAARRCARALRIPHIGTIGLFVLAKRRGLIIEVMPHIEKLRRAGLWVADSLVEDLRQKLEE